ncbi:hypothetical protein ACHAXN_008824 [Cyclotella atomus]
MSAEPPESLEEIEFCAEKCRYIPEMCSQNKYRDQLRLPAPKCLRYSTTVEGDIYWASHQSKDQLLNNKRHKKTVRLVTWAAARARERRGQSSTKKCEEIPSNNTAPMMFPEEFEFVVKVFANAKPQNYLEWGTGTSTSFYPLLAESKVYAIDGYPPWCQKVMAEPRIKCMIEDEKRLHFYCPEMTGADGVTEVQLLETGRISKDTPHADVEAAMSIYVNSIEKLDVKSLDIVLVDGRFRLQCALKLLPFLESNSILLLHDFWIRKPYHEVLRYYDVIGYARSVVALQKKNNLSREEERRVYLRYMNYESVPWIELM